LSLGLKQETVAERAGVARETVSRLERGDTPNLRTAVALAKVLQAGVTELFPLNDVSPAVTREADEHLNGGVSPYDTAS
jgi:DNA-binding XRE family transcriptional regulator